MKLAVIANSEEDLKISKDWTHARMYTFLKRQLPRPFEFFEAKAARAGQPAIWQVASQKGKLRVYEGEDLSAEDIQDRLVKGKGWSEVWIYLSESKQSRTLPTRLRHIPSWRSRDPNPDH